MANDCEDLESLTKQLSNLVTSLQQQGILDKYFDIFYKIKEDTGNPIFFLRTALAFCSNAERLLNNLHRALHFPVVDFNDIHEYNIKLKGSSSSIGLRGMALRCADLAKAINHESREGCVLALERLNREYQVAKDRLATILELERKITSLNNDKS